MEGNTKKRNKTYDLILHGTVKKVWNIYCEKDATDGRDGVLVGWLNENILKDAEVTFKTDPVIYITRYF